MHDLTRESSGELPLRLLRFLPAFYKTLRDAAKAGRITRQTPMSAEEICKRTNESWAKAGVKDELTDVDVRAMVNYLRRHGITICSVSKKGGGYWLGDEVEFRDWCSKMKSRIKTMQETLAQAEHGLELRDKYHGVSLQELKQQTIGAQQTLEAAEEALGPFMHIDDAVEEFFEKELMKCIEADVKGKAA